MSTEKEDKQLLADAIYSLSQHPTNVLNVKRVDGGFYTAVADGVLRTVRQRLSVQWRYLDHVVTARGVVYAIITDDKHVVHGTLFFTTEVQDSLDDNGRRNLHIEYHPSEGVWQFYVEKS